MFLMFRFATAKSPQSCESLFCTLHFANPLFYHLKWQRGSSRKTIHLLGEQQIRSIFIRLSHHQQYTVRYIYAPALDPPLSLACTHINQRIKLEYN